MRSIPAFACVLGLGLLAGTPSLAQQATSEFRLPCHRYDEIARQLGSRYKEAPVSLGVQTNGHLLQVFASPERGTWTILSTSPTGVACVIAAGSSWESMQLTNDPQA
jgi:hypothetical protein